MTKVDELDQPPIVGEVYLVPCIVEYNYKKETFIIPKGENILRCDQYGNYWIQVEDKEEITITYKNVFPIINHKHSDKENGQDYDHYHLDSRFLVNEDGNMKVYSGIRWDKKDPLIEYIALTCIGVTFKHITPVQLISKSKLKHNCIHKNKCPHRGMDMSQVVPVNGVITCPLHGLQFDENTRNIITATKLLIN
jgi:hypothetical protein